MTVSNQLSSSARSTKSRTALATKSGQQEGLLDLLVEAKVY